MKIWLSHKISKNTPIYGNNAGFLKKKINNLKEGGSCNTEWWQMPNHIGTHIDAPRHFSTTGATIDEYPAEFWCYYKPSLIEILFESGDWIYPDNNFSNISPDVDLLFIKTGFGKYRNNKKYWEDNPGLAPELAVYLRKTYPKLKAVGVDFISISRWQDRPKGRDSHKEFLGTNGNYDPILLIEDMDFSRVTKYSSIEKVYILPLRIEDTDASPCSIIAEVNN